MFIHAYLLEDPHTQYGRALPLRAIFSTNSWEFLVIDALRSISPPRAKSLALCLKCNYFAMKCHNQLHGQYQT